MASFTTLPSLFFLVALAQTLAQARIHGVYYGGSPQGAHHATSYDDGSDASGTIGRYGGDTAALFNNSLSCVPCSGIKCASGPHWCTSIFITATNFVTSTDFCLQNDVVHSDGGWCNPPRRPHFHLAMPMFLNNDANRPAFRYFNLVLIVDVGGAGDDMLRVSVNGTKAGWMPLSSEWGQNRQSNAILVGQSLSFRVTGGDGRTSTFPNIVPSTWQLGQTTDGKNTHLPIPTIPKHFQYRKLLSSMPAHIIAGITHTRPIHEFKLYWRPGPGFGIQSLPSEIQVPKSAAPAPAPVQY